MADKEQINFQLTKEDAAEVDRMAEADGYDNRSGWMRRLVRIEIARRKAFGVAAVKDMPFTADGNTVRLVEVEGKR